MDELRRVGTWSGWAGSAEAWPVSQRGKDVVQWALDHHERFFGDSWLTAMAEARRHPLLSPYDWPLSNVLPVIQLLERACRIDCLTEEPRLALASQHKIDAVEFEHLELLLEVASLATRAGWHVQIERPVVSGRKPDLRLERGGAAFTVEVTRMAMDRDMRKLDRWSDHMSLRLQKAQMDTGVSIAVTAQRSLDSLEAEAFVEAVSAAAAATGRDGMDRAFAQFGCHAEIRPSDDAPMFSFEGPATSSDAYGRLATRLVSKARQTLGGPPAWIRLDEVGGMFMLTDWSRQALPTQLAQLSDNVQVTLGEFPHVRGVILTGGAAPWNSGTREDSAVAAREDADAIGPAALVRRLPGGRARRTFVVPLRAQRIVLRPHVEAEPVQWYSNEGSWLDWALQQRGFGSLDTLLRVG